MALRIECWLRARQVVRARPHPSQTASIPKYSIIQKTFPAQDSAAHKKIFWPHLSDLGSVHRQFLWTTSAGNVVAQTHTNILSRGGQLSAPSLSRDNSCQNTLFSQNLIRDFEMRGLGWLSGLEVGAGGPGTVPDVPYVCLDDTKIQFRKFSSTGLGRPQEILVEPTFGPWICAQAISVKRLSWGMLVPGPLLQIVSWSLNYANLSWPSLISRFPTRI